MANPRKPEEMGLGEIVRELNLLSSVRTLSVVIPIGQAYARAPPGCQNPNDLFMREDILYSELNSRDERMTGRKKYSYHCSNCGTDEERPTMDSTLTCPTCGNSYEIRRI
jgi:hypothetical protein